MCQGASELLQRKAGLVHRRVGRRKWPSRILGKVAVTQATLVEVTLDSMKMCLSSPPRDSG